MLFCGREYRQAMVGTIAFYDASGERLHTNYIAAAPEHGKATFLQRMDEEIERIKKKYGGVRYIGISDGAADYLPWPTVWKTRITSLHKSRPTGLGLCTS
jgi:hypothetical protein